MHHTDPANLFGSGLIWIIRYCTRYVRNAILRNVNQWVPVLVDFIAKVRVLVTLCNSCDQKLYQAYKIGLYLVLKLYCLTPCRRAGGTGPAGGECGGYGCILSCLYLALKLYCLTLCRRAGGTGPAGGECGGRIAGWSLVHPQLPLRPHRKL